MELKLKFLMKDWITILKHISLEENNPNQDFSPSYKKEVIARNTEKKLFSLFLENLKKVQESNKELIKEAYINSQPYPFPDLIEAPKTKNGLLERTIFNILKKIEHKDLYYTLLENNKAPNYQELVWRISSESRRDNVVLRLDYSQNEDSYLNIFQSAIALCPPSEVQNAFEYFTNELKELEGIDSKQEFKVKENEKFASFHKAIRQTDMFGNGHAESIIYNLINITDIPFRAIKAVIDHVKEHNLKTI